eukprot:CAMPEP_0183449188 /NCGR_PEP_ID=MMETSP0370-20130417/108847_1 /TAXON_ID=268820 /ORGANISM="Peridinium aciculiferum, Strain PAER-2" /LENGTH=40 /DNA_ID= /DNA_START= /DNA_END= /DNA_ORIENTATION=
MALRPYIQAKTADKRSGSKSGKLTRPLHCSFMPLENILRK